MAKVEKKENIWYNFNKKERSRRVKYIELANKSDIALQKGISNIIMNTLPSAWDTKGIGWHEQWMNVEYSGVYASCEGIILLSQVKDKIYIEQYSNIIENVYCYNLCHIFDERDEIDLQSEYGINRKIQRDKTLNAVYKLAKFLWASSYVETKRDFILEKQILIKLCELYDVEQHLFKNTKTDKKGSILATTFAYIALCRIENESNGIIQDIEKEFLKYLDSLHTINEKNIDALVLILWGISHNLEKCNNLLVKKATRCMKLLLESGEVKKNYIYGERYNIRTAGIRDSFSINKYFVLILTLEKFVLVRLLKQQYINYVLDEINSIANVVMKNNAYSRDGKNESILFWENYYALQILDNFSNMVRELDYKEEEFMIVNPKYFANENYVVDEKLCVVIMPFNNDWSNDIYEVFKEAATEFEFWRSDEEYRDDIIIQTIWKKINEAQFVIADCTGKNPNAFYELGIAHTLGKPVFMCSQDRKDFPFDITHIRSYEYGLKPGEIKKLKNDIRKFIESI